MCVCVLFSKTSLNVFFCFCKKPNYIIFTFANCKPAHPSCDHDYLRVYSGNSSNGNLLANLCSDLRPAMISQTGQLFLDFKTDSSVTYRGFRVTYRAEGIETCFIEPCVIVLGILFHRSLNLLLSVS